MTFHTCPNCGARERIYEDTFSYRCPHCSNMITVPREAVEDSTSFKIIKKKKKKPVVVEEPISETQFIEDIYGYETK